MKKILLVCLVAISLYSALSAQMARGSGGGGRGGGGRGGSRGGARGASRPASTPRQNPNINRTPAMSRPATNRPANPPQNINRTVQQPPARPQPPQRAQQVRNNQPRPTLANQAHVRNETRQFTQQLRNVQGNVPRRMTQPQNFGSTLQNQSRIGAHASNLVGNNVRQRFPDSKSWFNDRFFESHRSYDFFRNPGANWWYAASWGSVASWLPYGWVDPYYYYYPGYSETIDYQPSSDLYVQVTDQAHQATQNVIEGVVSTDSGAWMPLGVFATGVSEEDAAYSNFFIQLALNNKGEITGTFYNAATDEAQTLAGTIDPKTQQAVWKISDNPDSPIMMTGLYNLTKDSTPVQVYFADEPQSWMLVRVNQ